MFSCFKDKAFLKKFFQIALPVMLAEFITFLVSFIDNIMVGSVSNIAVSAVYSANQVTYIFNLAIFGLLEGAGIFIQQFSGKNDTESIRTCVTLKRIFTLIFMIIVLPICYFLGEKLIYVYCKSDTNQTLILEESVNYLHIVIISYIPFSIGYIYSTTLREIGKTKYAMYASMVAIILNTLCNAMFIYVFKLGSKGAAYGTIIARVVEMLFLIIIVRIKHFDFYKLSSINECRTLFKRILNKSYLLFINELGFACGNMLQSLAFSQRDGVLSSISVLTTVSNIIIILIQGLAVGIGVMVGQDLGTNDFKKAEEDNKKLTQLGLYLSILLSLLLIAISPIIPNMFKEIDSSQKKLATELIIVFASLLVFYMLACCFYYTLKAGGRTVETLLLDTGFMLVVYVPVSWSLAISTNMNIIYIYLIVRSLDALKMILGLILVKRKKWLVNLTEQSEI